MRKSSRLLSLAVAMFVLFALLSAFSLTAMAADNIAYIDADGTQKTADNVELLSGDNLRTTLNTGWYYVTGSDIEYLQGLIVNGNVHLILCDGSNLTAIGGTNTQAGIQITSGNSLTIYAQISGTGELTAASLMDGAGIGGDSGDNGGEVTINGGVVTATSDKGAGIGGGGYGGYGGEVTINGGDVTATSFRGAGIGGGFRGDGGEVTINSGVVTATSAWGAGIGGGDEFGDGGEVTINDGVVTATSFRGAGIGGGSNGDGGEITINSGVVTATSARGAGIGGGYRGDGGEVTINSGVVTATSDWGAGIGGGDEGGDGGEVTINGGDVTATSDEGAGIGGGGNNGDGGEVTINGGVVTATSNWGAGIGGGNNRGDGGEVTINGGVVTAISDENAGIGGGGYGSDSGEVVINGGSLAGSIQPTPTTSSGKTVVRVNLNNQANVQSVLVNGEDFNINTNHNGHNTLYLFLPTDPTEHIVTVTTSSDTMYYRINWDGRAFNTFTAYEVTLTINKDDVGLDSHGKTFTLYESSSQQNTAGTGADSTVTFYAVDGTYEIYDGSINTGKTVTVSGAPETAILDYYTINFSVIDEGTAIGSTIGAICNNEIVTDGGIVPSGKSLTVTVTGAGADNYVYEWSGTATGNTNEFTTTVNSVVNAVCTVTGTAVITFNPNGGTVSPATLITDANGELATLPIPTRNGYTFDGWYTAIDGGIQVTENDVFINNTEIFAQWIAVNGGSSTGNAVIRSSTVSDSSNRPENQNTEISDEANNDANNETDDMISDNNLPDADVSETFETRFGGIYAVIAIVAVIALCGVGVYLLIVRPKFK